MCDLNKCLAATVLSVFVTGATGLVMGQAVTSPSGHLITASISGGGNNATFDVTGEPVDPLGFAADASLSDAASFKFSVDTESDVLLFDLAVNVTQGVLYDVPITGLGSNVRAPNPFLFAAFPRLRADTYFTTPDAGTAQAGVGVLDGAGQLFTIFDTVDNGPQSDFQFGQVTLVPNEVGIAVATVTGTLQTSASPTPIFDEFEATLMITPVPEPGSLALLSAAGLFGLLAFRRRRKALE